MEQVYNTVQGRDETREGGGGRGEERGREGARNRERERGVATSPYHYYMYMYIMQRIKETYLRIAWTSNYDVKTKYSCSAVCAILKL